MIECLPPHLAGSHLNINLLYANIALRPVATTLQHTSLPQYLGIGNHSVCLSVYLSIGHLAFPADGVRPAEPCTTPPHVEGVQPRQDWPLRLDPLCVRGPRRLHNRSGSISLYGRLSCPPFHLMKGAQTSSAADRWPSVPCLTCLVTVRRKLRLGWRLYSKAAGALVKTMC